MQSAAKWFIATIASYCAKQIALCDLENSFLGIHFLNQLNQAAANAARSSFTTVS